MCDKAQMQRFQFLNAYLITCIHTYIFVYVCMHLCFVYAHFPTDLHLNGSSRKTSIAFPLCYFRTWPLALHYGIVDKFTPKMTNRTVSVTVSASCSALQQIPLLISFLSHAHNFNNPLKNL